MSRGRLRVYLGAAPGVGKTFAMLDEGRRGCARGTDVVVGLVETHGRAHTAEQLEGLEVVPRAAARLPRDDVRRDGPRRACWPAGPRSRWSTSSRTPTSPAARHEKRWQDVDDAPRRRHRRHHHRQHPAPRVAQRRRRADHRRPAARDRPRRGGAPRRPDRARRPRPGGAAAPAGARQRLSARAGRRRAVQLLPGRQPHGAARARPALARRRVDEGAAALPRRARDRPALGGARADRRRADRRPRGRDAAAPRRADRGPDRRARTCSPCTSSRSDGLARVDPGEIGRAAPARRVAGRHLPPGRRRRRRRRARSTSRARRTPPRS